MKPFSSALNTFALLYFSIPRPICSFFTPTTRLHHEPKSRLFMVRSDLTLRRNVKVPLLDIQDPAVGSIPDLQTLVVLPLPSDHLPDELRDLNVYGMELKRPVHKLIIEDAIARAGSVPGNNKPIYGHLAWKPPEEDTLVGAIGCVSEIILHADSDSIAALQFGRVDQGRMPETQAQGGDPPKTVISCGAFRFVVKQVIQSAPFPVALVDELPDVEPASDGSFTEEKGSNNSFDDDDDDNNDVYADLSPPEMMKELFKVLQSYVDQKLEEASQQRISPLERAILDEAGGMPGEDPVSVEKTKAEQIAATLLTLRTSILDIAPTPMEGYFAISFLAAEIVDLTNAVRRKMLTMLDGAERLRFVLKQVKDAVGMERARKLANEITDKTDEGSKDLKVGTPELPPWSKQIRKGTKISYYWNEEYEWCDAEVVEEPFMVVDELLVTVRFEDGEIHKLPFNPDEKARWRPA